MWLGELTVMTIAIDLGRKATKTKQKKNMKIWYLSLLGKKSPLKAHIDIFSQARILKV